MILASFLTSIRSNESIIIEEWAPSQNSAFETEVSNLIIAYEKINV